MGSKKRLVDEISQHVVGSRILDACCGSGAVTQHLSNSGRIVIATDLLHFPGTIVRGSVGLTDSQKESATQFITYANTLKGKEGFFYNNYSGTRTYFLPHNAAFLDHYREEVENVADPKVKDYLLYCGLEAMSRIQNVCGMQACFLKNFKRTAKLAIHIKHEPTYPGVAHFRRINAKDVVREESFDTVYLDPPYNERQYGKTYHLYETFIRNDNPEIFGKTGQRKTLDEPSEFCQIYKYENAFIDFISNCKGRVIVSYNSEGNMKKDRFIELFSPKVIEMPLPKYNSHGKSDIVSEYLFIIDK